MGTSFQVMDDASVVSDLHCIADRANIQDLVTSVVYQRYTLGSLPTIGIELENNGTTVRVIIGWIEEHDLQAKDQLVSLEIVSK